MSTRAFVMSGGASLGAIQVGMIQALFERGVVPDLIVGASAGALNGAFIASREPVVETALALGEVWRGLRRSKVFPVNPLTGLVGFIGARDHLVSPRSLRHLVATHIQVATLEQMPIPLHVIATDILTGAEVRRSTGPAVDAILASAAIPGVFPPVQIDGLHLVDGGISDNAPLSHAVELGADEIYVLPTGFACALREPPDGALGMVLHAETLLVGQRLHLEIASYTETARLIVLSPPCPQPISPVDFDHADQLIASSLDVSRRFLGALDSGNGEFSTAAAASLIAHTHQVRTSGGDLTVKRT